MKTALLVIMDRRRVCWQLTYESLKNVTGVLHPKIMVDDSGDLEISEWLDHNYSNFSIHHNKINLGFALAMEKGWQLVRESGCDYVFNLQNDFVITEKVDLRQMASVLEYRPNLTQMSLRRQPWGEVEEKAGGFVELWPQAYIDMEWNGLHWLEHNLRFTMNPALIPAWVAREPWPEPDPELNCEGRFGAYLREKGFQAGIWGKRSDSPKVEHIGNEKSRRGGF